MDHHDIRAIRRLGAAVLSLFAEDQVKIFHAAMHGKKNLLLTPNKISVRELDAEISAVRRYMTSKDFRDICDLAGVDIRVEPAIAHMLRMARAFDGGRKGVTAELALNAWAAE